MIHGNAAYPSGGADKDEPTIQQRMRFGATGGMYPHILADPGNTDKDIKPTAGYTYCGLVSTSGNETRTLDRPLFVGQLLVLHYDIDGGTDVTIDVTEGCNQDSDTEIKFTAVGGLIMLVAVERAAGVFHWATIGVGITDANAVEADPAINA